MGKRTIGLPPGPQFWGRKPCYVIFSPRIGGRGASQCDKVKLHRRVWNESVSQSIKCIYPLLFEGRNKAANPAEIVLVNLMMDT